MRENGSCLALTSGEKRESFTVWEGLVAFKDSSQQFISPAPCVEVSDSSLFLPSFGHSVSSTRTLTSMAQRRFNVLVLGATGFTGRWISEYLATKSKDGKESFTWAVAGRSPERLEELVRHSEVRRVSYWYGLHC